MDFSQVKMGTECIMKILNERENFLCDYEVLKHLQDIKTSHNWIFQGENNEKAKLKKRSTAGGINLEVITRDLLNYLGKSPCSDVESPDSISELMAFINKFDLVKVEKLQIVNSLPRSFVHLYALVEECDQRFSQEQCDSIIDKINSLFPIKEEQLSEEVEK